VIDRHLSLAGPVLLALIGTLSCQDSSGRQLSREGYVHAPSQEAIAWVDSDRLLFFHLDDWMAGPDAIQPSCDSSGVYQLASTGERRPIRIGEQICEVRDASGADVSSDGRYLIYSEDGRLHRLDLQSGRQVTLTDSGVRLAQLPSWSPADQRIAFVARSSHSDSAGRPTLYLVNPDGTGLRQVRPLGERYIETSPSWSPDSRSLVIGVYPNGGRRPETVAEIVVLDTLGQSWRVVGAGHEPSWSPTGQWIAYLSFSRAGDDTSNTWTSSIQLMKPDGTGRRELDTTTTEQTAFGRFRDRTLNGSPFGRLVWSRDGARLAFRRIFGGRSTMWAIEVDGTGLTQLSPGDAASPPGR